MHKALIFLYAKLVYILLGSQVKVMNSNPPIAVAVTPAESNTEEQKAISAPAKKIVDINEPQTCRNKGCGKTFKEKDNHETACDYHPGPAVFHDRMRGVRTLPFLLFSVISVRICIWIMNLRRDQEKG